MRTAQYQRGFPLPLFTSQAASPQTPPPHESALKLSVYRHNSPMSPAGPFTGCKVVAEQSLLTVSEQHGLPLGWYFPHAFH